ncbi:solute carrier family 39 (zinc transporter), member 10 [Schistosoma bovis]|uniref:Solute carrier family 39 (Zinc transporter), member 10 n=1 Tax=Schistosoma bovis TaxID=6184 RepID=A0A430Q3R3_SCHBO|nr:solute carrier family 39 (zinc transporter), member 10 [Schistosoma bovis]
MNASYSTALNESQMCNCSPERPMDNSRCVDYLNEKQISGSDGANQPHWSFNNNIVPPTDTIEAVANIDQQHFNGGGVVVEGHYAKLSDLRKSSVHNNNKNINNVNKQTSVINNGGSVVDMLDVKQNNTTLELANPANNTPSQTGKPNAILRTNSSFDYFGGGEQIQTHPHRDKPHGHHHGHSHDLSSVRAIAYTIIAGDGLHNFCDGIAIGAAFANDMRGGLSTSIAVLCHELPHELAQLLNILQCTILPTNNTTLELANPANNTPSQTGKPNAILRTNSSFDYFGGGEQIQTHPHRDKPHGHHHGHSHDLSSVRAIAYTIIAGDGLHNFCDGIAIGAAFANDMRGGLSTSIAVLCHELPHELGDFAVLLHAGMSVKSALFYNLLSSILCAAGMIIGFLLGGMHSLDTWIFMLAAGMFIYIALVDMMPELSANQLKGNRRCHQPSVLFIWQNFGILLGFCIMLLIAFYEFQFISH